MNNNIFAQKFIYGLLLIIFFSALILTHDPILAASNLTKASDRISSSWPGSPSNHLIKFKTYNSIPGSGKIVISFSDNSYTIPVGFDFSDVDLATSDDILGEFENRDLGSDLNGGNDMVEATTGSGGSIIITLNPGRAIAGNTFVEIKLGLNSFFGQQGDLQILNPESIGSYKIHVESLGPSDNLLDRTDVFTAMVNPVNVALNMGKVRGNGRPVGSLLGNTTQTMMSLTTNYTATCSYAMIPDTSYGNMDGQFSNTGFNYHSTIITGLANGQWYHYYIRCWYTDGYIDFDDYEIKFYIEMPNTTGDGGDEGGTGGGTGNDSGAGTGGTPGSGETGGGVSGPGSGGGTGGGGGGGGGTLLGPTNNQIQVDESGNFLYPDQKPPYVNLIGWAYPSSQVNILKDGVLAKQVTANSGAGFNVTIGSLKEGVYTFNTWALDSDNRRSITKSSTFWIKEGTKTTSKVFLPTTISVDKNSVPLGDSILIAGQTIPSSKVEIRVYANNTEPIIKEVEAAKNGRWDLNFDTKSLSKNGSYYLKARTNQPGEGFSDFSETLNIGIGQAPEEELNTCQRSDMNKDKKVNLIDFSILLYNWGKVSDLADINKDGKVNLVDFSLMMYCWTG